jgi:hypothetical protein
MRRGNIAKKGIFLGAEMYDDSNFGRKAAGHVFI